MMVKLWLGLYAAYFVALSLVVQTAVFAVLLVIAAALITLWILDLVVYDIQVAEGDIEPIEGLE